MSTTMLYKYPGAVRLCHITGDSFDYIEVPDDEVKASLKDGWSLTPSEAKEKSKKPKRAKSGEGEKEPEKEPEGDETTEESTDSE